MDSGGQQQSEHNLRTQIARLKEDFVYNLGIISERDTELDSASTKIQSLQQQLDAREEELTRLRGLLAEHSHTKNENESKIEKLQIQVTAIESEKRQLGRRLEEMEALEATQRAEQNQRAQLEAEKEERRRQSQNARVIDLEVELEFAQKRLKTMDTTLKEETACLERRLKEETASLERRLKSAERNYEEALRREEKISARSQAILGETVTASDAKLHALHVECGNLQSDLNNYKMQSSAAQEELKHTKEQLAVAKKHLGEAVAEGEGLAKKCRDLELKLSDASGRLMIEQRNGDLGRKEAESIALGAASKHVEEIRSLRSQMAELEERYGILYSAHAQSVPAAVYREMQIRCEEAESTLRQHERMSKERAQQMREVMEHNSSMAKERIRELESALGAQEERLRQLKRSETEALNEVANLREADTQHRSKISKLLSQVDRMNGENCRVRRDMDDLTKEKQKLQEDRKKWTMEMSILDKVGSVTSQNRREILSVSERIREYDRKLRDLRSPSSSPCT